jgi:hypothetical protein
VGQNCVTVINRNYTYGTQTGQQRIPTTDLEESGYRTLLTLGLCIRIWVIRSMVSGLMSPMQKSCRIPDLDPDNKRLAVHSNK